MPLVSVRKVGDKYRLIDVGSYRISKTEANGVPRDGGGHKSRAKARRQAAYINNALKEKQ